MGEPDDRLEPSPVHPIGEHPVVSGPPTASVTGTIQHAGMKRHADEGGQRHRVGKGRTGMLIAFLDFQCGCDDLKINVIY